MSRDELRKRAEAYVDQQLEATAQTVSDSRRELLVKSAMEAAGYEGDDLGTPTTQPERRL